MEIFASKQYLFLDFLNFLTYQEIAQLRQISKTLCERIDNIKVWTRVIERDYPNLMILSELNTTVSLSLLKNKTSNKELAANKSINLGVFGTLGIFQAEIQENITLARNGFLGSMKEFVCNLGYCRFNIVVFPNVVSSKCQKKIIQTFLVLSKCEPGWEQEIKKTLKEVSEIGINKFVIGLRLSCDTTFVEELRRVYTNVVLVDTLTRENVKKLMKALVCVFNNTVLMNTEEDGLVKIRPDEIIKVEENNKKKCEVF